MIAQLAEVDAPLGGDWLQSASSWRSSSRNAGGGASTSAATMARKRLFPSSNIPCKDPAAGSMCYLAGGAEGGAIPLSLAATLLEIAPRISESAWMFFIR